MNKKELTNAFNERLISEEQFKEELFKLETMPKQKKKPRKLPVSLDEEDFNALMSVTKKKRFKAAFYFAYFMGLRVSEVVKLKPEDFDLNYRQVLLREAKGSKDRVVPLPKGFKANMLKALPLGYKNKTSGIRSLQIAFKGACKRAGLLDKKPTLKFHSLRHGFATRATQKGIPIDDLRTLLGHANISTTNIYLQANPKRAIESYEKYF